MEILGNRNVPQFDRRRVHVYFPAAGANSVSGADANGLTLDFKGMGTVSMLVNGRALVPTYDFTGAVTAGVSKLTLVNRTFNAGDVVVVDMLGSATIFNAYTKDETDQKVAATAALDGCVLITSGLFNGVLNGDVPLPTGYKSFRLIARGIEPSVNAAVLFARLAIAGQNSGNYYSGSGAYVWVEQYSDSRPTASVAQGSFSSADSSLVQSTGIILSAYTQVVAQGWPSLLTVDIEPGNPSRQGSISFHCTNWSAQANALSRTDGTGYVGAGGRLTGIRLNYTGVTNIQNCEYELYGWRG